MKIIMSTMVLDSLANLSAKTEQHNVSNSEPLDLRMKNAELFVLARNVCHETHGVLNNLRFCSGFDELFGR